MSNSSSGALRINNCCCCCCFVFNISVHIYAPCCKEKEKEKSNNSTFIDDGQRITPSRSSDSIVPSAAINYTRVISLPFTLCPPFPEPLSERSGFHSKHGRHCFDFATRWLLVFQESLIQHSLAFFKAN